MERLENILSPQVPSRIKVAFAFLAHTRWITWAPDASIPVRALTPLERSVETIALRAVQQYLLGEMDFAEGAPPAPKPVTGKNETPVEKEPSA
jgi:hypothetical protein